MKLGGFAMIPQLNAKVLNGSHQHHQKAKKFIFKSQKWSQCLCVSMTARELFTTVCLWETNCQTITGSFYLSVLERQWRRIRLVRPEYSAPSSWFLLHDNAPVHWALAVQEFLARKQVCVLNHPPYSSDLSPVIIFCSPNWSYHWRGTSLKTFKTSKEVWHRVFGPYHKETCRGCSSLC